jgi:hypothetical protein
MNRSFNNNLHILGAVNFKKLLLLPARHFQNLIQNVQCSLGEVISVSSESKLVIDK